LYDRLDNNMRAHSEFFSLSSIPERVDSSCSIVHVMAVKGSVYLMKAENQWEQPRRSSRTGWRGVGNYVAPVAVTLGVTVAVLAGVSAAQAAGEGQDSLSAAASSWHRASELPSFWNEDVRAIPLKMPGGESWPDSIPLVLTDEGIPADGPRVSGEEPVVMVDRQFTRVQAAMYWYCAVQDSNIKAMMRGDELGAVAGSTKSFLALPIIQTNPSVFVEWGSRVTKASEARDVDALIAEYATGCDVHASVVKPEYLRAADSNGEQK
jgi:hypothetical protein